MYNSHPVSGEIIPRSLTMKPPQITFTVEPNAAYTIIMTDPDAVSGDFLHWMVVNINTKSQREVIKYFPPTPPSGTHRYFFYLCMQTNIYTSNNWVNRSTFNTEKFIRNNGLQLVEIKMFKSQYGT